jgi:GNAT superfamily N-acetyltransferase
MAAKIRIRRTTDLELVSQLDSETYDYKYDYPVNLDGAVWWIAWDGDKPVAFAGVKKLLDDNLAYMCRVGVLESHRGLGIQRRLIAARLSWCRRQKGVHEVITYTIPSNVISSNNLIKSGFKLYRPEHLWEGPHNLYWSKSLK